jgi:hypothetical protein
MESGRARRLIDATSIFNCSFVATLVKVMQVLFYQIFGSKMAQLDNRRHFEMP